MKKGIIKLPRKSAERADELIRELYIAEYRNMLCYAQSVLGDRNLAETAIQETFVVALRKREQLIKSPEPVGWIYKALKYTMKHIYRDRQKLLLRTVSLFDEGNEIPEHYDRCEFMDAGIQDSPELQLLEDHYLKGYSIAEIAEKYGISPGACKMRMKRAREKLSKIIK